MILMNPNAFRIDGRTFRRMAAAGGFGDAKVELLGGQPTMMTSGPAHDYVVTRLNELLVARIGRDAWTVREEKPLRLGRFWRPLPDVAVVRGPALSHAHKTPGRVDIALLIEVADSTYARDAGKKLRHYLRCGVPAYWIVDLKRRRVELRDMLSVDGRVALVCAPGSSVPLSLGGLAFPPIAVDDLLS